MGANGFYISIHSPIAEADVCRFLLRSSLQRFQSTAPSQRLTIHMFYDDYCKTISIHSPIAEADSKYTYTFHILLIFLLNYTISPYYTQVILLLIPISIKTLIKLPGANLSQFSCALGIRTKVILVQKAKLSINFYEHHRPYT